MRLVALAIVCAAILILLLGLALISALFGWIALALLFIVLALSVFAVLLAAVAIKLCGAVKPPPARGPPPAIPDILPPAALSSALQTRLAGTPADGSSPTKVAPLPAVIWIDAGDELLVHLDSLQVRFVDRLAVVAIDAETDQTGRTTMVLPFALGDPADPAGLVAVTEEFPRGDARLASRWGEVLRSAMWSALLSLAVDHAKERGAAPRGFAVDAGSLRLSVGALLRSGAQP
jgi:hypothetical protein